MKKRITLLTLFLLAVMTMSAIPARPNLWRMITLADGSQVKARLVGDEQLEQTALSALDEDA